MSYIKKRAKRIKSINLLAYICMDENGESVHQSVGRTLNVSKTGILLETEMPLAPKHTILIEIGLNEDLIRAKGRPVYCREGQAPNKYENGIRLIQMDKASIEILKAYISAFREIKASDGTTLKKHRDDVSNVILLISGEHKIILKHIAEMRKIIEAPDPEIAAIQINMICDFLEQDVVLHMDLEDKVLFAAALDCKPTEGIQKRIERLSQEHRWIASEMKRIKKKVSQLVERRMPLDSIAIQMISKFIEVFKHHAKVEIVKLFPHIDANPQCKTLILDYAAKAKLL